MQGHQSSEKAIIAYEQPEQALDPRELPIEERLRLAEEHEKKLRHIVEDIPIKIKNQSGSSAGAGSSEFYIYRNARDAERKRVEAMEKEWLEQQSKLLAKREREEAEAALEAKTAKRRAKRQKQKDKKLAKKAANSEAKTGSGSDKADGLGPASRSGDGLQNSDAQHTLSPGIQNDLD